MPWSFCVCCRPHWNFVTPISWTWDLTNSEKPTNKENIYCFKKKYVPYNITVISSGFCASWIFLVNDVVKTENIMMKTLRNSDTVVLFSSASWQMVLTQKYLLFPMFILLEYSVFQNVKSYSNLLFLTLRIKVSLKSLFITIFYTVL